MRWLGAIHIILGTMAVISGVLSSVMVGIQGTPEISRFGFYAIILFVMAASGIHSGSQLFQAKGVPLSAYFFSWSIVVYVATSVAFDQKLSIRFASLVIYAVISFVVVFRQRTHCNSISQQSRESN